MLILTRKPGESLFIGDAVKITVMEIKGNQIRLGIDAPKELRIYREEIYLQIIEENKMASDVSAAESLGPISFGGSASFAGSSSSGTGGDDDSNDLSPKKLGLGNFVVKPVSGLNSMKGSFASRKVEGRSETFKEPEVVIRKKKKLTEEE